MPDEVDWELSREMFRRTAPGEDLRLDEDFDVLEIGAEDYLDAGEAVVISMRTVARGRATGRLIVGKHSLWRELRTIN